MSGERHIKTPDSYRYLDALNVIGPCGKDILVWYLVSKLGSSFVEGKYSISQVESILRGIIGEGASILAEEMDRGCRLEN